MVVLMVGVAERTGEREVIFPEMAALAIGMWIAPKRVWNVTRLQLVLLMGAGAVAGVCIVRWSPWPLAANLALAFAFAAGCLSLSRTTLVPLVSACMLPVLLHTESWVYPAAVTAMSLIVVVGQRAMERGGLRPETHYDRPEWNWRHDGVRWMWLLLAVLAVAALPLSTGYRYCILPPLIVTFVEFANSKSGFRNRPVQVWLMLVAGATAGTLMEWMGHVWLGWSESVVALVVCACLFVMFERVGRIDPDDCAAAGFVLAAGPDCLRGGGFHRCGTVAVPALLRMEPGAIRLLCRAFSVAALYSPAEQERAGHARINM